MLEFAEFGASFEEDLEDGESMLREVKLVHGAKGEKTKELLGELFFLPCLHMGLSPGCS